MKESILEQMTIDSTLSSRRLAMDSVVSHTSFRKYVQSISVIRLGRELNKDGFERRIQFFELIGERAVNNPNFQFCVFRTNVLSV